MNDGTDCVEVSMRADAAKFTNMIPAQHVESVESWSENVAHEEVIVELLKMKCLPVLFYGLESCPVMKHRSNHMTLQ